MTRIVAAVFMLLMIAGESQAADLLNIHSDQRYGFMIRYPATWQVSDLERDEVVAEFRSSSGASFVRLSMYLFRGEEEIFVGRYKNIVTQRLSKFPDSIFHSFQDSRSVYDIHADSKVDHVERNHRFRLMLFPEERVGFAIEGECLDDLNVGECQMIENIIQSFWVYNKQKLASKYPSPQDRSFRMSH